MTHSKLTIFALVALATAAGCSGRPEPAEIGGLTEGYWHCSKGGRDVVYELITVDGGIGGAVHMIEDGRQVAAADVTGVTLDGNDIEIHLTKLPPYRGQVDFDAGSMTGGHPNAGVYSEMNLKRVASADWPMVPTRPHEAQDSPWTRPVLTADGWTTGDPSEVGISPSAVSATLGAVLAGEAGQLHSLLLVRSGTLVVEEYYHGWTADDLHRLASCTKSVSSLLIGIAIDQGKISGVDVPLLDYFPERRAAAGDGWESLRLEHLLTMTMGLDWTDREVETFPPSGEDRFLDVLQRNVVEKPGTQWRYVSRQTDLLSQVLFRSTGSYADAIAKDHLFEPLGITSWDWENRRYEGHPSMSGTLKMRPRDMAKIGQLVLDRGMWDGRQVVSAEWIRQSTLPRVSPSSDENYGYLWRGFDEPLPSGVDLALGFGTQIIAVVPDLEMVIVVTGGNDYNNRILDIFGVLKRNLLPGTDGDTGSGGRS